MVELDDVDVPDWRTLLLEVRQGLISTIKTCERHIARLDELTKQVEALAIHAGEVGDALESRQERATQRDAARALVYETKNGLTARQVAEALRTAGYGRQLKWRSFYASVAKTLFDLAGDGQLIREVRSDRRLSTFAKPLPPQKPESFEEGFIPSSKIWKGEEDGGRASRSH